jgi:sarcosine oxidase/L-pipecolate oxidase
MPLLAREQIKGWKAVFSQDGGWLAAAKAINAIGEYLQKAGVKFGFGGYVDVRLQWNAVY